MNNITIFADSTCDLSKKQIEDNHIKILPLHVTFEGEGEYLDGANLFSEDVYEKVEKTGKLPKTGALNIGELTLAFEEELNKGNDIFFIGIGSGLSSSFNNAYLVSQELGSDRIAVVDGQNLSTGTGLLVLKACKFRDEGCSLKEIKEKVENLVPLVSSKFCIDRLDYLAKGGRCSGMTKLLAHALKIHPIAKVTNNKLSVSKMPRGKYFNAVKIQIDEFINDLPNMDQSVIFITHSGHMDGIEEQVRQELIKYVPNENIVTTVAGCTISSHCGPKTIGILYLLKEKK